MPDARVSDDEAGFASKRQREMKGRVSLGVWRSIPGSKTSQA